MMNDLGDLEYHQQYFRMTETRFADLFTRMEIKLQHASTHAMPVTPVQWLSLTLKILASGDSLRNTAKSYYYVGYDMARKILYETCDVLWDALHLEFLSLPSHHQWKEIANAFWDRWNFPLCLGALDGKHIVIKKPPKASSAYFNYKLDHLIVLMAVTDADYCFSYVDIGSYGRSSDGGVFGRSSFGQALKDEACNSLNIPGFAYLPGSDVVSPHVFVGDDAFALGPHIMKPYSGTKCTRAQ